MAKSLLTALVQTSRAMERERKRQERVSAREHASALRKYNQALKAEERAIAKMEKAALADKKAMEKAAKIAHIDMMKALAEEKNSELIQIYEDIDGLLEHTLHIDDYVDLNALRRTSDFPPFDPGKLGVPHIKPKPTELPIEPILEEPPKPKGIFGKKKKLALAKEKAKYEYDKAYSAWERKVKNIKSENDSKAEIHDNIENKRLKELEAAKNKFQNELVEHNNKLDELINGLGYGTSEAIEEYISIVLHNSVYPEHFPVDYKFTFDSQNAELKMSVSIPPPSKLENKKAFKYKQSTDEIDSTLLSMKAQKDRYSGAVHHVAIRTFHEIFEADRRGLIKAISIEVGTDHIIPSTGRNGFIPFVAAATDRETFLEFDLSGIVPLATLKHIGAAISKNPFELIAVDTSGVRKL